MSEECCVCLEPMTVSDAKLIATCQHMFHFYCARDLADKNSKSCPLCRADISALFDSMLGKRNPVPVLTAGMVFTCQITPPHAFADEWLARNQRDLLLTDDNVLDWTLIDRPLKARALYANALLFKAVEPPRVGLSVAFELTIGGGGQVFVVTPVLECVNIDRSLRKLIVFKVVDKKFINFLSLCTHVCREMLNEAIKGNDTLRHVAQQNSSATQMRGPFIDRNHIQLSLFDLSPQQAAEFVPGRQYILCLPIPKSVFVSALAQDPPARPWLKWRIVAD